MFLNEIIYLVKKKKLELVSLIPFKDAMVANATKEFFGPCPLSFSGRQGFNAPFILWYKSLFHRFGSQPCAYVRPFVTTKVEVRALELQSNTQFINMSHKK